MKNLNLLDYAEAQMKIPSDFLVSTSASNHPRAIQVILASVIDLLAASALTLVLVQLFQIEVFSTFPSKRVNVVLSASPEKLAQLFFMPIFFSYYFFSLFFNHGQSWGMHLFKMRVEMSEHDLFNSMKWSLRCMLMSCSYGLVYLFTSKEKLKTHDHLYHELTSHKDWSHRELVKDCNHSQQFEIELVRAAINYLSH